MFQALRLQEEEDEKFIQRLYGRTKDGKVVKRILDDENQDTQLSICVKQEVKYESVEEDQKPSCAFGDVTDLKPNISEQGIVMAHKRKSQKELLSGIVAVKKQKMGSNEPIVIKTEIHDTIDSSGDLPEYSALKKFEKNDKKSPPASSVPSSALQGLADYCSDSSSD